MRIILSILLLSVCYGAVIKVPEEYTTIQSGIDAAVAGDTVVVYPDLYNENITVNKSITLTSLALFDTTDNTIAESLDNWLEENGSIISVADDNINTTIINGSGADKSTVTIQGNDCIEPLILGFTIQNGSGTLVDRKYVDLNGETYTVAEHLGGGILSLWTNPTLHYNKIYNNGGVQSIKTGGAIYAVISDDDVEYRDLHSSDCNNDRFDLRFNFFENNKSSLGRHIGNRFFTDEFDLSNCVFDKWNCQNPDYQTKIWVNIDEIEDLTAENYQSNSCLRSEPTFVDPNLGHDDLNDGSEDSPFLTINKALASVVGSENAPVTINLAEGIYSPSENGETYPIDMMSYINFIGQGEDVTILDAEQTDRVITMIHCDGNTLSNFTISGGAREGESGSNSGGGMRLSNSSPILKNIIISSNTADGAGGGMILVDSHPDMNQVLISENTAGSASPGGGMCLYFSQPTLNQVTLSNNTANSGGGIFLQTSNPIISNMIIDGNESWRGGGMSISLSSSPTTTNINVTDNMGGGIYIYHSDPTLTNITISGNITEDRGGGIRMDNSNATLTNFTITGNMSAGGGGMALHDSNPILTNITISGNSSQGKSGGMLLSNCNPILTNTIIWDNISNSMDIYSSEPIITFSNIEGDTTWVGEGNINSDPLFTDPENDDYTLQDGSPCIDTGTADIDGDGYEDITEYVGLAPDMGAYEYDPLTIEEIPMPINYRFNSAYPNPFNPTTTISFSIPEFGLTTIIAYDITGRQLETLTDEVLSQGNYSINWNASSYPSGVYLIRMESGEFTQTQKVVLVK